MFALRMARVCETFRGKVQAKHDVVAGPRAPFFDRIAGEAGAGRRHVLIDRPHEGAILDHDIVGGGSGKRVGFPPAELGLAIDTGEDAQVLEFDVVRLHVDPATHDGDAGRRRGLTCNGDERFGDGEG